jgi:hypothetical protein
MSKSPSRQLVTLQGKLKLKIKIYILLNYWNKFFDIPVYQSSAEFSGWFGLKRKPRKTFDIIMSAKSLFYKFRFVGGGGLQPGSRPPPSGAPVLTNNSVIVTVVGLWDQKSAWQEVGRVIAICNFFLSNDEGRVR